MVVVQRIMAMPMAMAPCWNGHMGVQVMRIVMGVGVLLLQRLMGVFVAMRLQQMQHHADEHQYTTDHQHPSA